MFRWLLPSFLLLLRPTSSDLDLVPSTSSSSSSSLSTPSLGNIHGHFKDPVESRPTTTHFELNRPLTSLDKVHPHTPPTCTLTFHLLPHHPSPYSPPAAHGCTPSSSTWSLVFLRFLGSVTTHPLQSPSNDILSLWVGGVEVLRTTVPESPGLTASWETLKDITAYSSLLRDPSTLLCTTSSAVSSSYRVELTITYYGIGRVDPVVKANLPAIVYRYEYLNRLAKSLLVMGNNEKVLPEEGPNTSELSDHYENHTSPGHHSPPADLIIPVNRENGSWNRISGKNSVHSHDIQIPHSAWRASLEVYASAHGSDEFWYSSPPNSYARLMGGRGGEGGKHGSYREIFITIGNKTVAAELPFPLIFSGGINPYFWDPVVGIGAFNVPSYDFELTPFLGLLSDGKSHLLGLGISHSNPYWLLSANLHIWLDPSSADVAAWNIAHYYAPMQFSQKSSFDMLGDGSFESKAKRKVTSSGWVVAPGKGNVTVQVIQELEFKNQVRTSQEDGCLIVSIHQETESERKVTVKLSHTGEVISKMSVERKYPLSLNIRSCHITELESRFETSLNVSVKEEERRDDWGIGRSYDNRRSSEGWMQVRDSQVITNGTARTLQKISYRDEDGGCYTRMIKVDDRKITGDDTVTRCGGIADVK
ncbi:hypothetical protein MLD38_038258 [Melastoma candidum]|uniref:Uncharacterized protein n=1 Tax=Melastoma candidum TaxID=119954 RepID=A0ACB9KYB2_9MYRT|nr:hypothetical protein MLD38_038258 [Melastoma candidum]